MRSEVIEFNKSQRKDTIDFRAGDVVKVHRKIKEGDKERIQIFEGMIIAVKGKQSSSPMITVRKVSNGVGIEIIIPIFSPDIDKIELVKRAKVRQSKLYYIRDKAAKALRFKFKGGDEIVDANKDVDEKTVSENKKDDQKSEEQTNGTKKTEEKEVSKDSKETTSKN